MYIQTSAHLSRHVSGVWQCVGVAGGALAAFSVDKNVPLNDYACTLAILLCGWLIATTLDASNWFNRNITIISNIERLFLRQEDAELIHPFFLKHRAPGEPVRHFRIQIWLGLAVAALVLGYHYATRLQGNVSGPWFEHSRLLPYVAAAVVALACIKVYRTTKEDDQKLQQKSPGLKLRS